MERLHDQSVSGRTAEILKMFVQRMALSLSHEVLPVRLLSECRRSTKLRWSQLSPNAPALSIERSKVLNPQVGGIGTFTVAGRPIRRPRELNRGLVGMQDGESSP
jgi:hypothetical protein